MINPCHFKPVGEFLYGTGTVRPPHDEADSGGTESSDHPKKTFHSTSIAAKEAASFFI
jgi:hypothetical protein